MLIVYDDFDKFEENIFLNDGNLVIYGVGTLGNWLFSHFNKIFYKVKIDCLYGFCDKRAELKINGTDTYSISQLANVKNLYFFVCTRINEHHATVVDEEIKQAIQKVLGEEAEVHYYNINNLVQDKGNGTIFLRNYPLIYNNFQYLRATYNINTTVKDGSFNELLDEYFENINPVIKKLNGKEQYLLIDFKGRYFEILNGNRVTVPCIKREKKIWMFGDSRVLSVYTDNSSTISSFLQRKINDFQIINYGMKYRDPERIKWQITNADIGAGDFVICGTNFLYYESETEIEYLISIICDIKNYVDNRNATFIFYEIPSIWEINNKSEHEKFMQEHILENFEIKKLLEKKELFKHYLSYVGVIFVDGVMAFKYRDIQNNLFVDCHHYTEYGNFLLAEDLYVRLNELIKLNLSLRAEFVGEKRKMRKAAFLVECQKIKYSDRLESYKLEISKLKKQGKVNCGAIVMNANPFTKGHLYLISMARMYVDVLYIFVVEENKSEFKFDERFELVKAGTADFEDVVVLRSGQFIISALNFPEYFEKENNNGCIIDASLDIVTFAKEIAPVLSITKRFVGNEPYDNVTRQYNEQMKEILPQYNIDLIEIPRKEFEQEPISASRVRDKLREKDYSGLEELLPPCTLKKLMENNN